VLKLYDTVKLTEDVEQTLMPTHCIQYTFGAQLHSDLKIADRSVVIRHGTNAAIDSYSAFCDKNNDKTKYRTILDYELKKHAITDLYICGISTDGCVGEFYCNTIQPSYIIYIYAYSCTFFSGNCL
jgi:nicotinamidase/pyrazinamidase